MYLAIVSVGPDAAKHGNTITNVVDNVWQKYNSYLVSLFYNPKSANYPSGVSKTEAAVLWVEVEDSLKGKFKIIQKETRNFSYQNLDQLTARFLANYKFSPNPSGSGEPIITRVDSKGGTGIDDGNKPGAKNDSEGKGGDLGWSSTGGIFNLNLNIPLWLWLLGAGAGGLWFFSTDGKKMVIKLVSGGVTVWCTLNYLNKSEIKLPFKIPGILGAIPNTQRLPKRTNL